MMIRIVQAIRLAQNPPPIILSNCPGRGRVRRVRFMQSQPDNASHQETDEKDNETMTRNPNDKTGDVMSHSFGEGYATRSDEEGFGGIYGGNDSTCDANNQAHKPVIHENHPEYDRTQGSEVSETEKARNQKKVDE